MGIDTFRLVSAVTIGNGGSTAFWFDLWIGDLPLCERFPNLFSHSTRLNINVLTDFSTGLSGSLGPRLSLAAAPDLSALARELSLVTVR